MGIEFLCDQLKNPEKDAADLIDLQFTAFAVPRRYHSRDDAQRDTQPWLNDLSLGAIIAYAGDGIAGYALHRPFNLVTENIYRSMLTRVNEPIAYRRPTDPPRIQRSELAYVFMQREMQFNNDLGNGLFRLVLAEAERKQIARMYTCIWDKGEEHVKRYASIAGFKTLGVDPNYYTNSSATILRRDF